MLTTGNNVIGRIETITPAQAKIWLERNDKNRPVSDKSVADYARAMSEGRWKLNGQAISLSNTGKLLDGQHRLLACIAADVSFQSFVILGVDQKAFDTIDIGRKRLASDILAMDGFIHTAAIAGAVRWIRAYRNGAWDLANLRMGADEIRSVLMAEPGVQQSARTTLVTKSILAPSMATAAHYLFAEKDNAEADKFFQDLATGSELVSGDPVWVLRERLLKLKIQRAKLPKEEIFTMVIRAWNKRRSNETAAVARGVVMRDKNSKKSYPKVS